MLRFFFLLLILAGAALGIGYPWAASNVGYEIGNWRVFDRGSGFTPAEANIAAPEAPVSISVDVRTDRALRLLGHRPVLLMDVSGESGEPVTSAALDLANAEARTVNPQSGETAYREHAATLATIDRDRYRFAFRAAQGMQGRLVSVDLILKARAFDLDQRAITAGFIIMVVGVVGFAASLSRRRHVNPNSKPPPRWGRSGRI